MSKTWEYDGRVFDIVPERDGCVGCALFENPSSPGCVAQGVQCISHGAVYVERKPSPEVPPHKQAWFKNGDWNLESDRPLNRLSTRIVQYLFRGDTEASGCVEQHSIHVPAGIWAWREKPALRPAPAEAIEAPVEQTAAAVETAAGSKSTNPKDAIGIRKAPLSCVPMNVVAEMGLGMLEGAAKYGRHNYRGVGVRASVYFDATMRHLIAWWEGEDIDPDTGVNHIAKALASLAVLRDSQMQGLGTDDRPPRSVPFYADLNDKAAAVLDRHVDKTPRHYTIADTVTAAKEAP